MKTLIGAIAIILFAALAYVSSVAFSGLAIATANSWILGGNFSDAWHLVWSRQIIVFAWFIIFFVAFRLVIRYQPKRK